MSFLTFRPTSEGFFSLPDGIKRISLDFKPDDNLKGIYYLKYDVKSIFSKFRGIVKELNPDYVISAWTSTNCFVFLATFFLQCKVILTEHIHHDAPPRLWKLLRRILYQFASKVVF